MNCLMALHDVQGFPNLMLHICQEICGIIVLKTVNSIVRLRKNEYTMNSSDTSRQAISMVDVNQSVSQPVSQHVK